MGSRTDFLDEEGLLLEDRLKMIDEIHQEITRNPPNYMTPYREKNYCSIRSWTILLTWEGRGLRAFRDALIGTDEGDRNRRCGDFFRVLMRLPDLVFLCVKNPNDPAELEMSDEKTLNTLKRKRDKGVCPFTGTTDTETCHIIPTNANKRPTSISRAYSMVDGFPTEDVYKSLSEKLHVKSNILDTPSNMLLLSRQLCRLWEEGKFALEPLGYEKRETTPYSAAAWQPSTAQASTAVASDLVSSQGSSARPPDAERGHRAKKARLMESEAEREEEGKMEFGIKVRFHWLSQTGCGSLFDSYPEPEKASNPRSMFVSGGAADAVPIDDGRIITIWADDRSLLPDWDLLILQWHILRIHCLSGRADLDLYIYEGDQDEDPDLAARAAAAEKRVKDKIQEDEARAMAREQRELYALQLA